MDRASGAGKYRVVAYDPAWPQQFEALKQQLERALGDVALRIEHVGSTSVSGLGAKPIIDIQLSVADVMDRDAYRKPMQALGYEMHIYPGFEDYPVLDRPGVHVHVCTAGGDHEARHLIFRDYLGAHPEEARAYESEKRRVADAAKGDRDRYVDGKDAYVRELEKRALAWSAREKK